MDEQVFFQPVEGDVTAALNSVNLSVEPVSFSLLQFSLRAVERCETRGFEKQIQTSWVFISPCQENSWLHCQDKFRLWHHCSLYWSWLASLQLTTLFLFFHLPAYHWPFNSVHLLCLPTLSFVMSIQPPQHSGWSLFGEGGPEGGWRRGVWDSGHFALHGPTPH